MFLTSNRVVAGVSVLLILLGIFAFLSGNKPKNIVVLGGKEFIANIASTPEQRVQGLSGKKYLPPNSGLLFIFDYPDNYGIWMKDMNFSIDIIWISDTNKIVGLEKSISPNTFPKVFYPKEKSLYVFEIAEGQAELLNLKIGDEVKFLKK